VTDTTEGDRDCGTNTDAKDGHCTVKVAHIPQAGDYTVTTNADVTSFPSPRLAFGHPSRFWFVTWMFGGLFVVICMVWAALGAAARRRLRSASRSTPELLASGERIPGILKSFRTAGATVRSRGWTPSRPEFLDAPIFKLTVELHLPDRDAVLGRNEQLVPLTEVPNLAIGRELDCAVDPAHPANRFIVDWHAMVNEPSRDGFRAAPVAAALPYWPVVHYWRGADRPPHLQTRPPRQDRIEFAHGTYKYKREVLRTGAAGRATITALENLRRDLRRNEDDDRGLIYLELAVTVGADPPYAVRTGEYLGSLWLEGRPLLEGRDALAVGRELVVRVDLTDRRRVAVDWEKSGRLRQAPALRLQALARHLAAGSLSDVEYTAKREEIIADT
jgi:hypothetical protein